MLQNGLQKNFPAICLALTAILLFIFNLSSILNNPFFIGDSGFRLDHAGRIMLWSQHVWMPFLQMHIWALYKCGAPYWAFKLIPAVYFMIATLFLGLLTYRILHKGFWGLLFSIFLMIFFSFQPEVRFLGLNLYQEIIETALFYILLYLGALNLKKKWSLLIIATFALLTRDTFSLYLLVITVINYKKIILDTKYFCSFFWLWLIPIIWYGFCLFKMKLISSAAKIHLNGLSSFSSALQSSGTLYFVVALAGMAFFIFLFFRWNKSLEFKQEGFETDFKIFSLFSLVIIYGLYMLFDPWQCTFGNGRMMMPLLPHMFIWAGIIYKNIDECPVKWQILLRIILISGVVSMIGGPKKGNDDRSHNEIARFCYSMQDLRKNYYSIDKPMVCIIGKDYYDIIEPFIAPTLYTSREYILPKDILSFETCDMVIAPSQFVFKDLRFFKYDRLNLNNKGYYTIYLKGKWNGSKLVN